MTNNRNLHLDRRDFLSISGATLLGMTSMAGKLAGEPDSTAVPLEILPKQRREQLVVQSWRTFESGFHNGPTIRFNNLDPEEYMVRVRDAHTEVVIIETKSHWGYAYYDTEVGVKHPNLPYDLIARWVEAGHRLGLSVVAYYSGSFDLQAGLAHPEWIARNADGSPCMIRRFWYWCCHNSPYRNYTQGMYREIFGKYDFDGLFIDGPPWPRTSQDALCYCPSCQARYQKDRSEAFLEGLDTPRGLRRRLDWIQETAEHYLDEVQEIVHSFRPGAPVWRNHAHPISASTKVLRKTACLFGEPIDSPTGLSIASIVMRGWRQPGYQQGFFWNGYTCDPNDVEWFRTSSVLLQGARPRFVTDHQNMPDGRQRPEFYEWAKMLQADVQKVEGYLRNLEPVTSLGVVFSEPTRDHIAALGRHSYHPALGPHDFQESIGGAVELLTRTRYPVEVLPQWRLTPDVLAQFDLLVLPETESLAEAEGNALREYVHKGGILLATGKSGLFDERGEARSNFLLADVMGVDYVEEVRKYAGKDGPGIYLQSSGHPLADFLGSGEVAILGADARRQPAYCPFLRVRGSAESLFDYRLPYLVPDLDRHIFQTWNPAPPGNEKVAMAVTRHRYGQGQALYVGVPLFNRWRPGLHWIEEWVCGVVKRLVPDPGLRVEGKGAIHAAFYRQGKKQLVVQMVNSAVWTSDGEAGPARDLEIVGRSDRFPIRSARLLWPKEQLLKVVGGTRWRVLVPELAIYDVVGIQLA